MQKPSNQNNFRNLPKRPWTVILLIPFTMLLIHVHNKYTIEDKNEQHCEQKNLHACWSFWSWYVANEQMMTIGRWYIVFVWPKWGNWSCKTWEKRPTWTLRIHRLFVQNPLKINELTKSSLNQTYQHTTCGPDFEEIVTTAFYFKRLTWVTWVFEPHVDWGFVWQIATEDQLRYKELMNVKKIPKNYLLLRFNS